MYHFLSPPSEGGDRMIDPTYIECLAKKFQVTRSSARIDCDFVLIYGEHQRFGALCKKRRIQNWGGNLPLLSKRRYPRC